MRQTLKGLIALFIICLPVILLGNNNQLSENNSISTSKRSNRLLANADLYFHLKKTQKAIDILKNELRICKNSSVQSYLNFKIGMAYLDEGKFDIALPFINKFKTYKESIGDSLGMVEADIALGRYYYYLNDFSSASSILSHALNVMSHQKDDNLKAKAFLGLAEICIQTNSFIKAKEYAQNALAISSYMKSYDLEVSCFNVLSELYEAMGDYKSALYYKNKSVTLKYSIENNTTLALLNKSLVKGEALELVKVENEKVADYLFLNKIINNEEGGMLYWISISALFVFALVFFMLFRSKMILSKKLKNKNKELEKLNATKDKIFSIIAHDLKSPFNSLMGFSEVLSLQVESKSQQEIMQYSRSIHNSSRKLYSLVETLLQWSRTQLGTTEYQPAKMDVKILASNILSILRINAEEKDIVISLNMENDVIAWADKHLFSAVLRNLVSNAIKFSRVGSVISVSGKERGGNVEMSIADTGVGISKANLQKIFKVGTNITTAGTFNEKGTGLGLVLCKEFVEINRGIISAESKLEKGSTFRFTVPLSANYSLN